MLKFLKSKSTTGFTLIELLLVIAIFIVVFAFSAPYSLRFYYNQLANDIQSNIFSTLTQARHNALLQKNDSPWGVLVDPNNDQYILFQGSSYLSRNVSYDEVYDLLSDVAFAGDWTEVVFTKFTGIPNISGTSTITFNNFTRQIFISEDGGVNKI